MILLHFAGIEAASVDGVEAVAARHNSAAGYGQALQRRVENVIDRISLQQSFSKAKRGRACGLDGLQDDLSPSPRNSLRDMHIHYW